MLRIALICAFLLIGCARGPMKSDDPVMRKMEKPPRITLKEDIEFSTFNVALKRNIAHLKKKNPDSAMAFGHHSISTGKYVEALEKLLEFSSSKESSKEVEEYLNTNFELHEVYGTKDWGDVFITSYYEPIIPGRKRARGRFTQPLYSRPKDMTLVDLGEFARLLPQLEPIKGKVLEQKSRGTVVRGRIVQRPGKMAKVVPYLDREEIDSKNLLKKSTAPVLAYVDPIDSFFLQIQGSGAVQIPRKKLMRVGYDSQNGHPYVPIGKYLFDVIPREKMSLQTIEKHLRSLPDEEMQAILNKNPSYVFFRRLEGRGVTYFGTEVESGRTIATDYRYFPKGALAWMQFDAPIFEHKDDIEPRDWYPVSRLVFDQDTGGAIRGPGRVDLFWGQGESARQVAGVFKQKGKLRYLLPKRTNP